MTELDQLGGVNWRKIGVKRERRHESLIARLSLGDKSIFQYHKDLMVFAAMVGYSNNVRRKIDGDVIEIIMETYASDEKDSFIYLLGLLEHKDASVLKDANIRKCVGVFEEYCNAGLYTIESWLDDNPGDPSGVDTLLLKIFQKLADDMRSSEISNDDIHVEM